MLRGNFQNTLVFMCCLFLTACSDTPLNSPYKGVKVAQKTLFTSFSEQPKTLDPVKSYSSNEYTFLNQIYEPALTYHYLKRPYQLEPQSLTELPELTVIDNGGKVLSQYVLTLQKGILFQPHPAFAKDAKGRFRYIPISSNFLEDNNINALADFQYTGTRELTADDYIYQIKRLADPKNHSPIASLMAEHIVGFKALSEKLANLRKEKKHFNLRDIELAGVQKLNAHKYQITIYNKYPQFTYWLAMPFFAPMPWEAIAFYQQKGMKEKNISLNWYPVGTGPFMLVENNPNRHMVMAKNPNFRKVLFPSTGSQSDIEKGYLKNAGKPLPLIEEIYFSLEKESIPRWNKFLQGYYDFSGVGNDSFDQAISVSPDGVPSLTPSMKQQDIRLQSTIEPSIFYMGFNMLDDVVGGNSEKARKLRQAISIAMNYENYISIFLNGRGQIAQGPIPPGINGYQAGNKGMNPFVYQWQNDQLLRRPISDAKNLMKQAGYPNGRDEKTGKPLILNYDVPGGSGPEEKAHFAWLRKQFRQIGISLNIRATQYNRFQQKMRTGKAQIFSWGWNADYPDPENFLFLFLSSNGKVKYHGENAANYDNKKFDALFFKMRQLENGAKREAIIADMVKLLQKDSPWIWGYFPKQFSLKQTWTSFTKSSPIGAGTLRYVDIDAQSRVMKQKQWNRPIFWPLALLLLLIILSALPVIYAYYQRIHKAPKTYQKVSK